MAKVTLDQIKSLRDKTNVGIMDVKKALTKANGDEKKAMDLLREKGAKQAQKRSGNKTENGLTKIVSNGNVAVILEVDSESDSLPTNAKFQGLVSMIAKAILAHQPKTVADALKLSSKQGTIKDSITYITQITHENINLSRFQIVKKNDDDHFGIYVHNGGQIASLVVVNGADDSVAGNVAMHVAAMDPEYLVPSDISEDRMNHEKAVLKKEALNSGKPAKIVKMMINGRLKKRLSQICLADQQFVMNSDQTVAKYVKANHGQLKSFIRYEVGETANDQQ